jgi:hypothetical protein
VKALISRAISACRAAGKYIGICGQGPERPPGLRRLAGQRRHRRDLAEPRFGSSDLARLATPLSVRALPIGSAYLCSASRAPRVPAAAGLPLQL